VDAFAFIIHPIDPKQDVSRKFPFLGKMLTEKQINFFSSYFPPVYISEINGVVSEATGKEIKGWFIACPYTPVRMMGLPVKTVYRKLIQTGRYAQKLGSKILGLGAFTSVVGDAGVSVAQQLEIPVTTGDSYTVAVTVRSLVEAARIMEIDVSKASAAVVGATGAIGRVCAELLSDLVIDLHLVGRRHEALEEICAELGSCKANISTSTQMDLLAGMDLVITVTSSLEAIIRPEHLKPGSVVCDVSRPRDVSANVAQTRQDVLVIDGGMVEVPGWVDFHFDFGFPPGKAYACMAETMALTLEGRFENFTLGKHIQRKKVEEIAVIADRHGFKLNGFRSFDREVTPAHIEQIKERARTGRRK
jgi:predicted amino acid dehydrogenase